VVILASVDGEHAAVSAMREAEVAADGVFRALAGYVDLVAEGDEIISLGDFCERTYPLDKSNRLLDWENPTFNG